MSIFRPPQVRVALTARFDVTKRDQVRGRLKTPTLRNVALTAPYMHDGSLATLEEVVEFYSKGSNPNLNLDREIRALNFTAEERGDLIVFLKALTGDAGGTGPVRPQSDQSR